MQLSTLRLRIRESLTAVWWGLALGLGALMSFLLVIATSAIVIAFVIGIGALALPILMPVVRRFCNAARAASSRSGITVEIPYRPLPAVIERDIVGWVRRCMWILGDPATWRDLCWLLLNSILGLLGLVPALCIYGAVLVFGHAIGGWPSAERWRYAPDLVHPMNSFWSAVVAVALVLVGFSIGPMILRGHAAFARALLGPTTSSPAVFVPACKAWIEQLRQRATRAGTDTLFGLVVAVASEISLALFIVNFYVLIFVLIGVGLLLLPTATRAVRWFTELSRQLAGRYGVTIESPYRTPPELNDDDGLVRLVATCKWILTDPATWRDLLWLFLNALVGLSGLLPAALLYYVGEGLILSAGLWEPIKAAGHTRWYGPILVEDEWSALLAALFAVLLFALWLWFAPLVMAVHARFTALFLRPTKQASLVVRARHLAETRSDAIDFQAAELRRIERDLHDGAQSQLVGMGLTLGAAERHLDSDPAAARTLLREARASSASALADLRNLVRGIHPPILAERGLPDALRALAMASPIDVQVTVGFVGELPSPIESTIYFTVSELLANVLKHADAQHVFIDTRHSLSMLHVHVSDDGHGGANFGGGSGLTGIRRRLAPFDGTISVVSPFGGPTVIELEVPCALSSPKISFS